MPHSSKSFADWPLDGQIGLVVCILAIACLLCGHMFNRPDDYAAKKEGGHFLMRPLRSSAVTGLGFFLMMGIISYAVSQAGHCSTMTDGQNWQNQLIGIALACALGLATAYYFFSIYVVRYRFNEQEFIVENPWGGARRYSWSDLKSLDVRQGRPYFKFSDKGFYIPYGRSGGAQLVTAIDAKILRLDAPLVPYQEDEAYKLLIGKSVLVHIMKADEQLAGTLARTGIGVIERADRDAIIVKFESGNVLRATGNLRSLSATGNQPEFMASWFVEDPSVIPAM